MPAGVAAAQARISAIEARFSVPAPAATQQAAAFEAILANARAEPLPATATVGLPGTARALHIDHAHGAERLYSTEMGPAGAPAELEAYGNGRIPASALTPIGQGQHRLWAPAASSFQRMAEAAARDGITLRVTDSYRTYDQQVSLAERKGLYSQGGLAARPGTSNHGWGRAVDLDTSGGATEWLRANAARFGFHEDVPREPWHWTYRPG